MTVKRALNELETAGLIMRVRQGVGETNRIYVLIPGQDCGNGCDREADKQDSVLVLLPFGYTNIPLFHRYVPSARYDLAVSRSGFSTNFSTE